MRILRRHLGFTTNSSASSEWTGGPVGQTTPPGSKPLAAPDPAAPPATAPTQTAAYGGAAEAPGRPSPLWDNVLVLGGILLAILGIFAIERLVRRRLRRRKAADDV
jgi:hypothetical protein